MLAGPLERGTIVEGIENEATAREWLNGPGYTVFGEKKKCRGEIVASGAMKA